MNENGFTRCTRVGKGQLMKTLALIAATGSLAAISAPASAAEIAPAPGIAQTDMFSFASAYGDPPPHARAYGRYRDRDYRYDDDDYYDRYDRRDRRRDARRIRSRDQVWRGRDGRYYCDRGDGTTGLVVGAVGGALLGRVIDRRGDRTVGTLLGGALGAVIGREIDRSELSCR